MQECCWNADIQSTVNSFLLLSVAMNQTKTSKKPKVPMWLFVYTVNRSKLGSLCVLFEERYVYLWARWSLNEPFAVHSLRFQSFALLLHHSRLYDALRPIHLKLTRCNTLSVTNPFTAVLFLCSPDRIILNLPGSVRGVSTSLNSGSGKTAVGLV